MHTSRIRVRYQETDRMKVAHHASYLGWLEAARTELMRSLGTSYREAEERGLFLPVIEVWCRYQRPVDYDDEIVIEVRASGRGATLEFNYQLRSPDGSPIAQAKTRHAWTGADGRPKNPAHYLPGLWAAFTGQT